MAPVSIESEHVAASYAEGTSPHFLWVHVSLANAAAERFLRRTFALPEEFCQSLSELQAAVRLEEVEDTLVATLHDVRFDFTFDPERIATILFAPLGVWS